MTNPETFDSWWDREMSMKMFDEDSERCARDAWMKQQQRIDQLTNDLLSLNATLNDEGERADKLKDLYHASQKENTRLREALVKIAFTPLYEDKPLDFEIMVAQEALCEKPTENIPNNIP